MEIKKKIYGENYIENYCNFKVLFKIIPNLEDKVGIRELLFIKLEINKI